MRINRHLRPEEKLAVLRLADTGRKWSSLDDRRVCILCDRAISGRMIEIWQNKNGTYRVHCPTTDCISSPTEWIPPKSARRVLRNLGRTNPAPVIDFAAAVLP